MKQLLPLLMLLLLCFGACSEKVRVTVYGGSMDPVEGRNVVYGVDTVWVACDPFRDISYVELRIDGALVGVDTFPGPESGFEWDVRQLPEASVHILQARAISGSREYLSPELPVMVGLRSRLALDGPQKLLCIYYPDGKFAMSFEPVPDAFPSCPRLRSGCHSAVFLADHELYQTPLESDQAHLLAQVANGIYSCDASPVSDLVAFEGYPAGTAHLFTVDSFGKKSQLTQDSDFVIIDSSRFTCIENSVPVFSPDGTRLAYFRKSKCLVPGDPHENETRKDAFVMSSNGGNPFNLTAGVDDADFSSFTWTFDGKWVLFRVGTGHNAHGVCAANMSGHAVTGVFIPSAALACSPVDSTLVYADPGYAGRLYWKKLGWTDDTIYADTVGLPFGEDATCLNDHIDWVRFSKQ
jgi:hypothetical protein